MNMSINVLDVFIIIILSYLSNMYFIHHTDFYYERIQLQHHHDNGPGVVAGGEPSNGPPGAAKKPNTAYTIEEILKKPVAPRPRPPSPCGLLVDGVCTCGLTATSSGDMVSAAFYVDVQRQVMQCSQLHSHSVDY